MGHLPQGSAALVAWERCNRMVTLTGTKPQEFQCAVG